MNIPDDLHEKKKLAAVCGLFCPSCTVYIGTQDDPQRLKVLAERYQLPVESWECQGCRSEKRSYYCENICPMVTCAAERGIEFCGECNEYPCQELKKFQAERPHRIELWEAQGRIAEIGFSAWFDEMKDHYSCPKCRTINSAYDRVCRVCGSEPSCRYVELHQGEIDDFFSKSK